MQLNSRNGATYWSKFPGLLGLKYKLINEKGIDQILKKYYYANYKLLNIFANV